MFLLILQDDTVVKSDTITKEDYEDADKGDGVISIIDLTNPANPLDYIDGKWHKVEDIKRLI